MLAIFGGAGRGTAKGSPAQGIPAGTKWEDLPEDWECPDCGAEKEDFKLLK